MVHLLSTLESQIVIVRFIHHLITCVCLEWKMKTYKVLPQVLIAIAGELQFKTLKRKHYHIVSANGGSFLFGISLGWSAPNGPKILTPNHEFSMTTNEFSWAVAMMPLGCALSSVFAGIIRSRLGTKNTIFIFAFPNFLGWMLISFAWSRLMVC